MKWVSIIIILAVVFFALFFIMQKLNSVQKKVLLPYKIKYRLFSRSEMIFLKILDNNIDHAKYTVFPKVRLADFIEVISVKEEYQKWFNKIKSKHIDFLLWDLNEHKIAVAIELDGNSHDSDKMKERDSFVNELYETVGIRLERVRVGEDFNGEVQKIISRL